MDLKIIAVVDISLLVVALWCILKVSEWSVFNPSLWWVGLHAYGVTSRLISLNLGARSLSLIGIRSDLELVRAGIAADVTLLAVVAATIFVAFRTGAETGASPTGNDRARLNQYAGHVISLLCVTIGTYALIKFGWVAAAARARGVDITAINIGGFAESSYPIAIAGFAVQGGLIQCAMRGFNRWRLVLLIVLLVLTSLNLTRTAFVLPAVMAFLIYQTMRRQHALTLKWALAVPVLGLLWFAFKPISGVIRAGEDPRTIPASVQSYFMESTSSGSLDSQLLDMQATYMAAADEADKRYYGATLLPLLYLPIPRFVWPDKPLQNAYAWELASSRRPIEPVGMTAQLSGESYVNFGWFGCAAIPFLYVLGMQTAYIRVRNRDVTSVARWIYLILLISMVQVFRDGLVSLITFPLVMYLPLVAWGGISKLLAKRETQEDPLDVHQAVPAQSRRLS